MNDAASNQLPFDEGSGSAHWISRDGHHLEIRHIRPEDAELLVDLYHRLSAESLAMRFATAMINVPLKRIIAESARLAAVDPMSGAALVALFQEPDGQHIVGVARLAGRQGTSAEFALTIRDDFQGQGLGTYLFDLLLQLALVRGLETVTASVLAENRPMLMLIRKVGFPFDIATSHGESDVTIYLQATKPDPKEDHQ